MIKIVRNALTVAAALSTAWACSADHKPVDIGDGRGGERLEDYAAAWEGYAEAYQFSDGSDKVRISLDSSGNGTMEIGNSPRLPVATDPDVTYPPGYQGSSALVPGFAYAIGTATVESARIRFTLDVWQIEHDWCNLQTQTYDSFIAGGSGGAASMDISGLFHADIPPGQTVGPSTTYGLTRYRCAPASRSTAMDFYKWRVCWDGVCSCDEHSCTSYVPPSGAMTSHPQLDAALDSGGNTLVGTLIYGEKITVRLKRIHDN